MPKLNRNKLSILIKLFFPAILLGIFLLLLAAPDAIKAKEGWIDLIEDPSAVFDRPNMPKPGYLQSIIDPVFGTKITRVSGDPGTSIPNVGGTWPDVCKHRYSLDQAWNADETLLYLSKGCRLFLDGETYEVISNTRPPGEHRWHPTNPDLMVYVSDNEVGYWNARTEEKKVVHAFNSYSNFQFGPRKGNLTSDGKQLAIVAKRNSDGRWVFFAYDLEEKERKSPDINLDYSGSEPPRSGLHNVTISLLGNYMIERYGSDSRRVYDMRGRVVSDWPEYGQPSHCDITVDENGDEVAVGVSKSAPYNGNLIKRRLRDGQITKLSPGGKRLGSSHTSARNLSRPGWVYTSHPRYDPFKNEVIAVYLDGTKMQRFAYIPNKWADFPTEPQGAPSPDGRRIVIGSNWNKGDRPVQAYVIDARAGSLPTPTPPPNPYDLNGDKQVNATDVVMLLGNWVNGSQGDFNEDGKVNSLDFGTLIANWDSSE